MKAVTENILTSFCAVNYIDKLLEKPKFLHTFSKFMYQLFTAKFLSFSFHKFLSSLDPKSERKIRTYDIRTAF